MDVFATGLVLGESPRWHDGRLWVCDWVAGEVLSFDTDGERRVELTMSGLPFSVDWLPDGRTVLTSTDGVVTVEDEGTVAAYGATGQGWNEIVVDPRGSTFVNAPGFDLMGGEEPRAGSVWVVRPDGSSVEVADDVRFPNGMAVSADGGTPRPPGSVSMPREPPGRPTYPTSAACASLRVVRCSRSWRPTAAASPACSASAIGQGERTGQILTHRAPAPHAGRP